MLNRPVLALAAFTLAGCAKIVVVKVPDGQTVKADGVIYALPNTVARIQLKVDKTTIKPAPYVEFAKIFAPDSDAVCKTQCTAGEKAPTYAVRDGATFSTYGEPDPANVYNVKFTGGGAIDQSLTMTWNEAGLLSAASATVTNRTSDIALSGLKLATSLGTKAFGLGAATAKNNENQCSDGLANDADEKVIPILRTAGLDSATLVGNYCAIDPAERKPIAADHELLSSAVTAFDPVSKLEKARSDLLSGSNSQVLEPAALLPLIEAEISRQLTKLYLGSKSTKTWEGTLDIRSLRPGSLDILRVDPRKGLCVAKDAEIPPAGKPFPEGFTVLPPDECAAANPVSFGISYYPESARQLYSKMTDVDTGDRSFRYRIPAQVKAQVLDKKKVYGAGVFSVAQMGTIVSLPAKRRSKSLTYDLSFVEATGALKTFKLGTTGALDASTIDSLSGAGGAVLDARNKALQNSSESAVLTREDTLLKLKDDICTIQTKYGLPCSIQP